VIDARFARFIFEKRTLELTDRIGETSRLFGATSTNLAPELVERIFNVSTELQALTTMWYGTIYYGALWTSDVLVLLLVISMGVLGSALNLLAVFVANQSASDQRQSLSFGEYPLRLAFGAVTAIVVFIIAKAGIPILADTSKLGGASPINPYFISFLAIVSGLMSDRALETIRNIASNLLRSGSAALTARYARVNIDEALKSAGRTVEGLARVLGRSTEETKKLFSGKDLVQPDEQKLIGAYLDLSSRDLFSDEPAA
jgi:hypothetical protein